MAFLRESLSTKSGYMEGLFTSIGRLNNDVINERISKRLPSTLSNSIYVPELFEIGKEDPLSHTAEIRATNLDQITFNLPGGEIVEIGKYSQKTAYGDSKNYGLAVRIAGVNPSGEMHQHPWVMVVQSREASRINQLVATPLVKQTLAYGESDEIVRWCALFNPQDIINGENDIQFRREQYPKLVVLHSWGVSLADFPLNSDISIETFQLELEQLEQLRKSVQTNSHVAPELEIFQDKVNIHRMAALQQITAFEDIPRLFHQNYLQELFGNDAHEWVIALFQTLEAMGPAPITWSLENWQMVQYNPFDGDASVPEDIFQHMKQFVIENQLVIDLPQSNKSKNMITNPYVVRTVKKLVD